MINSEKELYTLTIKPFAENEVGNKITEFDEEEWELIVDVFQRLIRNFKQTFPEVEFDTLEQDSSTGTSDSSRSDQRKLIIKFREDPNITEVELDYHIETLCGHNLDNVIFFDDDEYSIRGSLIVDAITPKPEISESTVSNNINDLKPKIRSPKKKKVKSPTKKVKSPPKKKVKSPIKKVKSPPKKKVKTPSKKDSEPEENTLERYTKIYEFFASESNVKK
jgi:hypothetical protein